ncbi:MAG TPA: hypothetical protein VJ783_18380 [Pirellulales bacterium]|nr:hypothetical protein [Pirellulales bacterium]
MKNTADAGNRGQQGGAAWQSPEPSAGPASRTSRDQLDERIMQHCVDLCGETAAHCLEKLEQGDEAYAALLHAAVECQDSFCAYWSELTGPGGAWRAMAAESCAIACESLATTCRSFMPQDAQAQQCAEACQAASELLRRALRT